MVLETRDFAHIRDIKRGLTQKGYPFRVPDGYWENDSFPVYKGIVSY